MLTIAYEITALARNPFGGIARTCYHTLEQAVASRKVNARAFYRHGDLHNIQIADVRARRWSWHSYATAPRYRIVHALCHRLPNLRADRIVYTIHDAWSLYPNPYQGAEFQERIGWRMRRELTRADLVIADSHATQERLLSLGIVKPEVCHIVPLGVSMPAASLTESSDPKIRRILATKYVLFVGRLEYRKNIPHILDAVRPHESLTVVLAGEPGFGYEDTVKEALGRFPQHRLVRLERISTDDLTSLYSRAVVTLIPSWEEGFGLPILEAMAAGSLVITSDRSASAEIARDAALLVNPEEPSQSSDAISRILNDPALRAQLTAAGKSRAAEYTWQRYFGRLLELYSSLT